MLAVALSKQTGSGYKYLSHVFALPSLQTLVKFMHKIPVKPGINETIFGALKLESAKFKNQQDKYCMLLFDEMSIMTQLSYNQKEDKVDGFHTSNKDELAFANYVQVFMIRGIRRRWKQPVFYNFSSGPTKTMHIVKTIKVIVSKLKEAGLIVCSIICDQGTNNCAALKYLVDQTREHKVRSRKEMDLSEFYFEVEGQKIIPLFDTPHLIKCIRNNFLKYNIEYFMDGIKKTAKWDHVLKAYKMDPYFGSLRTMPNLTDFHVVPEKIPKMKVSYCTQTLSRTVAIAINLMAHSETTVEIDGDIYKMDKGAADTASILEFFNDLFDSLNCIGRSTKRYCRPVRENSPHHQFWVDSIRLLQSMKFVGQKHSFRPPCLNNFIKTIRNFAELFKLLRGFGFEYIKTRQFNQDPLENFFGQIRQRGGRYVNPTCEAFGAFYKSLIIKNLAAKHSSGSNCEDDKVDMFFNLQNLLEQGLHDNQDEVVMQEEVACQYVEAPILPTISYIEKQSLHYVLGFILKKIKPLIKDCAFCTAAMFTDTVDESHTFTSLKEYVVGGKSLTYISDNVQKHVSDDVPLPDPEPVNRTISINM